MVDNIACVHVCVSTCLCVSDQASGLSLWLGGKLAPLEDVPPFAISIILCLLIATFTECSSNTATTTLFLPVLASMVGRFACPKNELKQPTNKKKKSDCYLKCQHIIFSDSQNLCSRIK